MIHQKILETLCSDGPQSYRDLKCRLRSGKTSEIAFPAIDLLMGVGALVSFAVFVSIAEIIQLFLDSENNTRQAAEYLKQLVELQAPPSPTPKSEPANPAPAARPKPAIKPVARARKAPASQAESIRSLIKHLHGDGLSPDEITEELKNEGLPTLTGEPEWTCDQVKAALEAAAK